MNKSIGRLTLLFCVVYFTSYITRINYGALVIAIADSLNISNSLAGLPISFSFMSYGIGQLIAGYLGDKIDSKKIISTGLLITALMNVSIVLTKDIMIITILWTINGFGQALLWPPLVKIMLSVFDNQQYKKSSSLVIMSASLATILIYILVPICLMYFEYQIIFVASALLGLSALLVWHFNMSKVDSIKMNLNTVISKDSVIKIMIKTGLIPILVVIVIQGFMRDGITTWMPAFINEMFNQSASMAILSTTILPASSIVAVLVTRKWADKIKSELMLSSYIWFIALFSSALLYFSRDNMVLAIINLTLMSSCMHGTNLLLIGNLPARYLAYGKTSTISGILNACTYVGSALSAYGIAKLNELYGWDVTLLLWIALIIIAGLLCFKNRKAI